MVAKNGSDANPATSSVSQIQNDIISTQRTKGAQSATQEAHIDSMSLVRGYLKDKGLSTTATTVIEKAWRSGTRKRYATYLQKWKLHCTARGIDPFNPSVEAGINFLVVLFDSNIGYSAINTARSALSSIAMLPDGSQFGTHTLVCQFVEGVFELKPSLPKYKSIWDVRIVLKHLSEYLTPQKLTLKKLTLKTTMPLALLSGQRCHTLQRLSVNNMVLGKDTCKFTIVELLKTSKPGRHMSELVVKAYTPDNRLCPIACLSEYVKRTSTIRKECGQLLLSFQKPHKPVSTDSISRWLKEVLAMSGIDTTVYKGHSTRSASTSVAETSKVPLSTIMENVGWSNAETFRTFYSF